MGKVNYEKKSDLTKIFYSLGRYILHTCIVQNENVKHH